MQMLYNRSHTDWRHFLQYEEYKRWLEELERQEKEFYRHEFRLPTVDKWIDYSWDYKRELDRLISLWYRKYCIDFDYRHSTVRVCMDG
jgi:hypothetical protein